MDNSDNIERNSRPISDGSKGFPKHTVCVSGYPKKQKSKNTKKKYDKNKTIALVTLYCLLPVFVAIVTYIYCLFC